MPAIIFPRAALRHDAGARLATLTVPVSRIIDPLSAIGAAYGDRLHALIERMTAPS